MNKLTKNNQLAVNMLASMIAYGVNLIISFFLSPYIVKNIGVDAYGFIGLANNFVSYASLITIALNSLAGRFVTVKIYEKDINGANRYFSSVFFANTFLTLVLGAIFLFIIIFLEKIINVPAHLVLDVRWLFICLFLNCMLGTIGSGFGVATFATNKLYLNSARIIESNIIKIIITVLLFIIFVPRVSYLGITSLFTTAYVMIINIYYVRTLTPYLEIKRSNFDIMAVKELIVSGIWNTITRVGQLLLDGLDLLITNLFISSVAMGVLSLAKVLPNAITGLTGNLVEVFSPNFTMLYAEKKYDELVKELKKSIKIMSIIVNIPIIILMSCGDLFFALWQPTQDPHQLQLLSFLSCACLIISGGLNCIYNIFTVFNKIKINSLVVILSGVVSTAIVFILLKTTSLGIYAVAGVSTGVSIIRNLAFTLPYGAHCIGKKWYVFYVDILRPVIYALISCLVIFVIKNIYVFSGWFDLFILGIISVVVAIIISGFLMMNSNDRKYFVAILKRRIKK